MTGWLLGTNILSDLRRPRPERKVLAFVASQPLELFYVSTVTLAEIRFGIERVPDAARRSEHTSEYAKARVPAFNPWVDDLQDSAGPARGG